MGEDEVLEENEGVVLPQETIDAIKNVIVPELKQVLSGHLIQLDEKLDGVIQKIYYTPRDIADMFGLNYRTVLEHIHKGKLKSKKIGKEFKVSQYDLNQYMQNSKKLNPKRIEHGEGN